MIRSGEPIYRPTGFVLHCECGAWISGIIPGGSRVPYFVPCPRCFFMNPVGDMMTVIDYEKDCVGKWTMAQLIGNQNAESAQG